MGRNWSGWTFGMIYERLNIVSSVIDLLIFIFVPLIAYAVGSYWTKVQEQKRIREQMTNLANNTLEMSTADFFEMRRKSFGGRGNPQYANQFNFSGVYILHNKTKDLYYVGQARQVLTRVNNHFTGKGNGDVYADYKHGDEWTIKLIALENSGFKTLNELERHIINTSDSVRNGYNKTRGNS